MAANSGKAQVMYLGIREQPTLTLKISDIAISLVDKFIHPPRPNLESRAPVRFSPGSAIVEEGILPDFYLQKYLQYSILTSSDWILPFAQYKSRSDLNWTLYGSDSEVVRMADQNVIGSASSIVNVRPICTSIRTDPV